MFRETLAALQLKVTVDGTVYAGDLRPGDLVRFEEKFGHGLFGDVNPDEALLLQDTDPQNPSDEAKKVLGKMGLGMTQLFYLAYLGVRRTVEFKDYDDFLDRMEDLEVAAGDSASLGKDPSPAG
jgi:hypothetical protein